MSKSPPALVKPSLLVWARERAGLSLETASAKAAVEGAVLTAWENGSERPSLAQLRKLGEVYKRPIAVFFLPEPPKDFDPQQEFRRLPGRRRSEPSAELRLALRSALYQRASALELYDEMGEQAPKVQEAIRLGDTESAVVRKVRGLLGISWAAQLKWSSAYEAFNHWRGAIERLGVLVFQTGGIAVTEMRGTSIPHGPLPLILINNADAPHGRVFTLIHEFVHVLLANGGHDTSRAEGMRPAEEQILERFGNRMTAAILMPVEEFAAEAAKYGGALSGDDSDLKRFADRLKVSPEAVLRRLVSIGLARPSVYRDRRKAWLANKQWYVRPPGEGGPPIEVKVVSSRGRGFVSLVLEGYERNIISSSTVADLLGVKLKYLDKVAGQLIGRPGEGVAA